MRYEPIDPATPPRQDEHHTPVSARQVQLIALTGIGPVRAGDDLAALIAGAVQAAGMRARSGDVFVVASKVVSKALGLRVPVSERADKVLTESSQIVAERATGDAVTRIVRTIAGPTLAGAGIDASNVGSDPGEADTVLLLPRDPDRCARNLRAALAQHCEQPHIGVIIADTSGRPWRVGQVDYALGASGVRVLDDLRGSRDGDGRPLTVTMRALADELASAADLVKGKSLAVAAVLIRGLAEGVPALAEAEFADAEASGAAQLIRPADEDWFGRGEREAVRSALGIEPGSPQAQQVGLPHLDEPRASQAHQLADTDALRRAIAAATLPRGLHEMGVGCLGREPDDVAASPLVRMTAGPAQVHVAARDHFTLGVACTRLCIALAAEGIRAHVVPAEQSSPLDPAAGRSQCHRSGEHQWVRALVAFQ